MGNAPSDSKASDAEEENDDQNGINDNQVSKKEYNHKFTENHGPGEKLREKYNHFASGITYSISGSFTIQTVFLRPFSHLGLEIVRHSPTQLLFALAEINRSVKSRLWGNVCTLLKNLLHSMIKDFCFRTTPGMLVFTVFKKDLRLQSRVYMRGQSIPKCFSNLDECVCCS